MFFTLPVSYKNGNTKVWLHPDGTKVRSWKEGETPNPEFPECIDLNITNWCDQGCKFCYQNATKHGIFANYRKFLPLLNSIHPYTEIAVNGNNISNPFFINFLNYMYTRKVIVNTTVNFHHALNNLDYIEYLFKENLINSLGLSVPDKLTLTEINTFYSSFKGNSYSWYKDRIVWHTIAGITSPNTFNILSNLQDEKVLILGYKNIGRGSIYSKNNLNEINQKIKSLKLMLFTYNFKVLSFDNLALKQLNIKEHIPNWEKFYMGDDGKFSFYIDLVKEKFYKSSLESNSEGYPLKDNIIDMFNIIRNNKED